MVRQCAWCLCLIDHNGERISSSPLSKLYEATHGMCGICGALWIEQVLGTQWPMLATPGQNNEVAVDVEVGEATVLHTLPIHHS